MRRPHATTERAPGSGLVGAGEGDPVDVGVRDERVTHDLASGDRLTCMRGGLELRARLSPMADRAEDPRSAPPIRWGILGAGNIAASFASAVNAHTRAQLVAVGSRNRDRAALSRSARTSVTTGISAMITSAKPDAHSHSRRLRSAR